MISLEELLTYLSSNTYTLVTLVLVILLYLVYLWYFKYHEVIMKGDYQTKGKNIGKTLPPFPNGWYIVCKSSDLPIGQSKAIDQNNHNITIFRAKTGKVYALHSYCAHLGANLGIGGKVVNQKCIQCPFHGWLYDGETGACVDYNNKPMRVLNVEYNDDVTSKQCDHFEWKHGKEQTAKLRKYHVKQVHGFIYVWLHVDENQEPEFDFINIESFQSKLSNRGYTKHTIRCHPQDIPENGADAYHFKYVHKLPIAGLGWLQFVWTPVWKAGNDPDLPAVFEHSSKPIREFKQQIYNKLVKDHKNKEYLSFANIDNYILVPFLGKFFVFNLTVVQMGPGLVYVFLKTRFFTTVFIQYLQCKQKYHNELYHEMYTSNYLPYWITAIMLRGQAIQVYNDMLIWDSKKFGNKIHYKEGFQADEFILKWRAWFSKYYKGCKPEGKEEKESLNW